MAEITIFIEVAHLILSTEIMAIPITEATLVGVIISSSIIVTIVVIYSWTWVNLIIAADKHSIEIAIVIIRDQYHLILHDFKIMVIFRGVKESDTIVIQTDI